MKSDMQVFSPNRTSGAVITFVSGRPVTCAVSDYARRLRDAVEAQRPGAMRIVSIEPDRPAAFVGAVVRALRRNETVHFQTPIEGWGNSLVPGVALFAARLLTRRGRIVITLHEWTSLNALRYLSMLPNIFVANGFVFVSPRERDAFWLTPWVGRAKKAAAPIIPIGPNIMPARIDPARVAAERGRLVGEGAAKADLVVGFFGVLYGSKRPDLLLRVTRALHATGCKARLLVCGDFLHDKPADRDAFFALAREFDLLDWLEFRGRIDDEGALMEALSAADAFLLPYSDGVSLRRGSFQAVSQLALPLVTTAPEQPHEFDGCPPLKAKIESAATALVPADSTPGVFAEAVLSVYGRRSQAVGVALEAVWREAAAAHLAFYDRLDGEPTAKSARIGGAGLEPAE